ncbi:MAG: hypothetical protein ABMA64_11110 [Myxococcota bacterium]
MKQELDVLIEQLDELLGEPIVDPDDALEVAIVAGLAARLSASPDAMAAAVAWRDGDGRELLAETWDQVDPEPLLEELDAVTESSVTEEQVEEAVYDFDDVVAAAVWCGKAQVMRAAARRAAEIVRQIPDPFADLSDVGSELARLPTVAEHLELYDYWLAIADAHHSLVDPD